MPHRRLLIQNLLDGHSLQRAEVAAHLAVLSEGLKRLAGPTVRPPLLKGGGAGLGRGFGINLLFSSV
jgi:hypothetical protein